MPGDPGHADANSIVGMDGPGLTAGLYVLGVERFST